MGKSECFAFVVGVEAVSVEHNRTRLGRCTNMAAKVHKNSTAPRPHTIQPTPARTRPTRPQKACCNTSPKPWNTPTWTGFPKSNKGNSWASSTLDQANKNGGQTQPTMAVRAAKEKDKQNRHSVAKCCVIGKARRTAQGAKRTAPASHKVGWDTRNGAVGP